MRRGPVVGLVAAFLLVAAAVLLAAPPAAATPRGLEIDVVGDGAGMGELPNGPVLRGGENLVPGDLAVGQVLVRSDRRGTVSVRATDLRSADNGCVEPETQAGDTTCGDGEGELLDATVVTVGTNGATLWEGPLRTLAVSGIDGLAVRSGDELTLDWRARVSPEAGNEVQTDSVTFGLAFALDTGAGEMTGTTGAADGREVVEVTGMGLVASTPVLPLGTVVTVVAGLCIGSGPVVARLVRRRRPC